MSPLQSGSTFGAGAGPPLPDIKQPSAPLQNLHEIDTKKFLADQIGQDINKFRNAEAFVNAGLERIQGIPNGTGLAASTGPMQARQVTSHNEIMEDIMERESPRGDEDFDDAASSLSKELQLAKL